MWTSTGPGSASAPIQFNRTDGRFYLNGQPLKLRGLNRHESYPYIGRAAPNRLQVRDADILKYELGVNIVRTSHYPQDPEFLDRADEIGLLVMEEIPGWQHIGNTAWQDIAVENVREMVMRDRNHPSIVLWGVRINESGDNRDLLHPHQQPGPPARSVPPDRRRAQLHGQRVPRGRLHLQRLLGHGRTTRPCCPG